MINPIPDEALCSAAYVDNYIKSVENLPDDVQRHLSRIRDIDVQYRTLLRDVSHYYELWKSKQSTPEPASSRKCRLMARMQQCLIQAQELGDEKMQVVNQLQELIDFKTRQLDVDKIKLDIKEAVPQQVRVDQLQQPEDYAGSTPPKLTRLQSPPRIEHMLISASTSSAPAAIVDRHVGNTNFGATAKDPSSNSGFSGSVSSGGGPSTPNSDRSAIVSGSASSSGPPSAQVSVNLPIANQATSESQRPANKRSRRRNDNSINMELIGQESNSANETGSNNSGIERKTSSVSAGQKKTATQSQTGLAASVAATGTGSSGGAGGGNNSGGKKKKRKARGAHSTSTVTTAREETPPPETIDPDEPTYCVCNQISFGEMILCDNDLCPIEWFHFSCVALVLKPKGKWFCPNCRGDRPSVMKPKAQFLKELERYNKEKEEKT